MSDRCKVDRVITFSLFDSTIILVFLVLGFSTRTFSIAWPPYCIFDEVHFGSFTNFYLKRSHFIDVHPPLAKLIWLAVSYISGYRGTIDWEAAIRAQIPHPVYVTLRLVTASFSALVPALGFATMRVMHFSTSSSSLAAVLLLTDSMLVMEGRYALTHGILHCFVLLALFSLVILNRAGSSFSLCCTGLFAGSAFSVKYTSLSLLVVIAFSHSCSITNSHLLSLFEPNSDENEKLYVFVEYLPDFCTNKNFLLLLKQGIIITRIALSILLASFVVHLILI
jgi:dolichyl-phosphate-mannose-protein mannosyltransferase